MISDDEIKEFIDDAKNKIEDYKALINCLQELLWYRNAVWHDKSLREYIREYD